jgi:hypothetical protein
MVFYEISRLLRTNITLPTHLDRLHDRVTEAEDLPQHRVELLRAHGGRTNTARLARTHVVHVIHFAREFRAGAAWQVKEHLAEQGRRVGLALGDGPGVGHGL